MSLNFIFEVYWAQGMMIWLITKLSRVSERVKVTLISIVHVYIVVKSFYFSVFHLLLSVHVSI